MFKKKHRKNGFHLGKGERMEQGNVVWLSGRIKEKEEPNKG